MSAIALAADPADDLQKQCGKIATVLVITDMFYPEMEAMPVCRLAPTVHNFFWHTRWHFSTQFLTQILAVMGLIASEPTTHKQFHRDARTRFSLSSEGAHELRYV